MNAKKVLPLVLAVVLGLIAAVMMTRIVKNQISKAPTGPTSPKIVMLKNPVDPGQSLTPDDLVLGQIGGDTIPDGAFKDISDVVGRVAAGPMVAGQPVLRTLLADPKMGAGLAAIIKPGMRAFTVEINEFSGVAGFLIPGCKVDVLHTMRDETAGESMARAIVKDVEVMAVGQRRMTTPNGDEAPQAVRSVTLLVTPRQAEQIELASMNGRPRLVLRNGADNDVSESQGVTLTELRGQKKKEPKMTLAMDTTTRPSSDPFAGAGTGGVDPFGPATRPSAKPQWAVQVFSSTGANTFRFTLPEKPQLNNTAVTNTDASPVEK